MRATIRSRTGPPSPKGWGHGQTKGYHFEHNYGHGQQHLAAFLLTLILRAVLCQTLLDLLNTKYQLLRQALAARRTFCDDLRALTRYWVFDTWTRGLTL